MSFKRQGSSSSSYSAHSITTRSRSISSPSTMSLSGLTQGRVYSRPFQTHSASIIGRMGDLGTRTSQAASIFSAGSLTSYGETSVIGDEKLTMQNLNDRLGSYLAKVRSLEAANSKLELQIREFYEKRTLSVSRDDRAYFATISDLQAQIARRYADNQRIILQIDNAQLAVDDFKMKYETELNMHNIVEADVLRLRGVRDSLTLSITDLEGQIESLKEELLYMKKNHEEELTQLRIQCSGSVNVEVDSAESTDLSKILEELREEYEAVMIKNKAELEKWYHEKVESLSVTISACTQDVQTYVTELSELRRTYQSLEINCQSVHTEIQCLQQNLEEVKSRYSIQLSQLQMTITTLETELQQLKASVEQLQTEYSLLLDIKMRLEMEISEYRRLLEGEREQKKVVVISKVVEKVEEHKPHIEKRVKTIVEEVIDGRVVSSTVDTQVESIQ